MGLAHQAIEYRLLDPDFILNQQEEDEDEQDDEAEEQDAPRPIRPFPLDHSFDVRAYSDTYSIQEFRFTCAQLQEIIGLLRIPPFIVTPSRDKVDSLTVLCMAMYRLSFPERLNRMERMFRRSAPSISRLINQIVRWVMLRWDRLLYWDEHRLTREKLSEYADACYHASGGQCNNVFAFVDGTAREIQMPTINQQAMYSGHKCHHCVKYQGIVAPDGILLHLSSAFSGTNHDMTIFDGTGFQQVLDQFAYDQNGVALAIYGDSAYTANGHVLIGYRGNGLTPDQIAFNRVMSSLRVTIEWTFKHITQQFMGIDFPRTHRLPVHMDRRSL
ncbi:nuclease HARBI1 [Entomortierella parvispora]|uniref:Nuclease HARBI1 n=1 Tax=Entomortierella parvispora TaxID=205924 RepID=A0A9P3M159_9FUNG|nr:nuclease HARBI1 [Entomortierella parvispora]